MADAIGQPDPIDLAASLGILEMPQVASSNSKTLWDRVRRNYAAHHVRDAMPGRAK